MCKYVLDGYHRLDIPIIVPVYCQFELFLIFDINLPKLYVLENTIHHR